MDSVSISLCDPRVNKITCFPIITASLVMKTKSSAFSLLFANFKISLKVKLTRTKNPKIPPFFTRFYPLDEGREQRPVLSVRKTWSLYSVYATLFFLVFHTIIIISDLFLSSSLLRLLCLRLCLVRHESVISNFPDSTTEVIYACCMSVVVILVPPLETWFLLLPFFTHLDRDDQIVNVKQIYACVW